VHERLPARARLIEHQGRLLEAADQALGLQAIGDQVRDREDAQAVLLRELLEVRHARHRAVVLDDLADDGGRVEPRHAREVDRALRLASAHQHAAAPGLQREHVPGHDDVVGLRLRVDRKSTRLNSSHVKISYAVFCLKKKKNTPSYDTLQSFSNLQYWYIFQMLSP